ncbi:MAG: hypothetical protein IJI22_00065 [Bacilli bacterium]|nr:hypothetical protein [Bacilli bacterium]
MLKNILILLFFINILIPINIPKEDNYKNQETIGQIIIPKLNIKKNLYRIDSKENTIEKNIEILKDSIFPDQENGLMILAAHSGTGDIAYFNELDKLKKKIKYI